MNSRRRFLVTTLATGSLVASVGAWAAPHRWSAYPFTLGVASGYPTPDGAVIWTRLAPQPLTPSGGIEDALLAVQWEVARDADFKTVVANGTAFAEAAWAHSVHVQVRGLTPWSWYHYRFHSGDASSASGRFRTAPRADEAVSQVSFAAVSCQHYEAGYYAA